VSPGFEPPSAWPSAWTARLLFVLSAAAAALALLLAWEAPLAGAAGLTFLLTLIGARWLSRRRVRRLLRSGDVESILQRWAASLTRVPHPETMGPLMTATAFAAYGWIKRAREVLRTAERGPAWEAALEHRLFVDVLLLTFEGDSENALARAGELAKLPLPSAAPPLVDRVRVLREAVAALARAFSHQGVDGDCKLLIDASDVSPLVHWAMRYGAAILLVDAGDVSQARLLLSDAPPWPSESCFSLFHEQIFGEVTRLEGGPPAASPTEAEPTDADAAAHAVQEDDGPEIDR
jgi:hypothetical protein